MANTTTHASISQSTLTDPTIGCLNIGQVPTQQIAIPTQPIYSSDLQMPTNMMKISMPIPTTTYQYVGQSSIAPPLPPHNTFGNPYNFGGGFTNPQ